VRGESDGRSRQLAPAPPYQRKPNLALAAWAAVLGLLVLFPGLSSAGDKVPPGYHIAPIIQNNGGGPVGLRHHYVLDLTLGQPMVGVSRSSIDKYQLGVGFWYLTGIPHPGVSGVPGENHSPKLLTSLGQNIPNPFNPMTTIRFTVGQSGFVSLKLYNVQGKLVATLVQESLAVGEHRLVFQPRELASGVYLYRLETADGVLTRRLTLLK